MLAHHYRFVLANIASDEPLTTLLRRAIERHNSLLIAGFGRRMKGH